MQVNQQALQQIYQGVKTIFNKAFNSAEPKYKKVATEVPSSGRSESYKWLGKLPKMREWIGERVVQNIGGHSYTIENKDWEMTIGIDRNDIEDDAIGVYSPLFQEMGDAAALHPDDIVFDLLTKGFTEKCYDGKTYFHAEHPCGKDGKKKHSNTSNYKLGFEAYGEARASMQSIPGEDGRIISISPRLLLVGPGDEAMGKKILTSEKWGDEDNPYRGTAELEVVPEFANHPGMWMLIDNKRPVKPIIFQRRKAPKLVKRDKDDDEAVFMKKEFQYGVDSRDNVGFSFWQIAFGSKGTTDYPQA